MPRASCHPVKPPGTASDRSPERGVRTAESSSRSSSPICESQFVTRRSRISVEPSQRERANIDDSLKEQHTFITLRAASISLKSLLEATRTQHNYKTKNESIHELHDHEATSENESIQELHDHKATSKNDLTQEFSQLDDKKLDCPDELYNLTKLAEVSLAAAAGHVFSKRSTDTKLQVPEQEFPEDLSQECNEREEHTCLDCGKRYSTSSNLARHRQTHRSLADKKARRCPHCDKVYVSMPAFAMHMRTHNQGCRCPFCGKCFSRPWLLQGHIRTHTGEKPFQCSICHKAFADKSNLRAHVQTHSSLKPHTCLRCGKAFALKSYLYKHEESSCMKMSYNDPKRPSKLPILLPDRPLSR